MKTPVTRTVNGKDYYAITGTAYDYAKMSIYEAINIVSILDNFKYAHVMIIIEVKKE